MIIPTIPNSKKLDSIQGDPEGYVTKDGKWAAVPCGTNFVILHEGKQVHTTNSFRTAKDYILNKQKQTPRKRKSTSSLEQHFT